MNSVEEIKFAVTQLPTEQLAQFRQWFLEKEADDWDRQIESDIKAGKLDFLVHEALHEYQSGKTRPL